MIQSFIKNKTTKGNIQFTLTNTELAKFALEAESLTVLLDIFNFFEECISIKEITLSIKKDNT